MQHMIVSVHLGLIRLAFIFKIYIQRFIANRQVCKTLTETTAIKTQHYSFCQGKGKVKIRQLPITTRSLTVLSSLSVQQFRLEYSFFRHFQFNWSILAGQVMNFSRQVSTPQKSKTQIRGFFNHRWWPSIADLMMCTRHPVRKRLMI